MLNGRKCLCHLSGTFLPSFNWKPNYYASQKLGIREGPYILIST